MFILRWLSVAFALVAGSLTSQLPEFAQQYRQRLGGAIDEINRMLADFDMDAKANDLTRAQGIEKLRRDADQFIALRGRRMEEADVRAARLVRQQQSFESAGSVGRILAMSRDFDAGIASRAWQNFEPGVPLTGEGLLAAATGFFAGIGLWHAIGFPFARRRRRLAALRAGGTRA